MMTDETDLPFRYDTAEGPKGLREVLDNYLLKSQNDRVFADTGHYILYVLGEQRSLIRVDTSTVPFYFRYCDLLGRPATKAVRETIARFLWEKCGEKERFMRDVATRDRGQS